MAPFIHRVRVGRSERGPMEIWDVIVIGAGPAGSHGRINGAERGASTLMISTGPIDSAPGRSSIGLATSLQETSSRLHREDTIRTGDYLNDHDIVAERINLASEIVATLERQGVNFERDASGLPRVRSSNGHTQPLLAGAGDGFGQSIQRVLEEQALRRGVTRMGDMVPMDLVTTDRQAQGIIAVDLMRGEVRAFGATSIILADASYEGAWQDRPTGIGMDLALRAGIPLRDMEMIGWTPMRLSGTSLEVPWSILSSEATLHDGAGNPIPSNDSVNQVIGSVAEAGGILDLRPLSDDPWWARTLRSIESATGVDPAKRALGVEIGASFGIGGLPTDEHGRVVDGSWTRWFTGLYAAGGAACTGLHGANVLPGNALLDELTSGLAAGRHAASWSERTDFSGVKALQDSQAFASATLDARSNIDGEGIVRIGDLPLHLSSILNEAMGPLRSSVELNDALGKLEALGQSLNEVRFDSESLLMNQAVLDLRQLEAAVRLSTAATRAALQRRESRGAHRRSDFDERDDEDHLRHTLIDLDGNEGWLSVRKTVSDSWIVAPGS